MKFPKLPEIRCLRCRHRWKPRTNEVRQCPKCKSAWFDRPKEINGLLKENNDGS